MSRSGPVALALVVITVGVVADIPALVPVGMLVGTLGVARLLWIRRGLRGFEYQRVLGTRHAVWGDRVPVTVTIWNRSWLPVAWLTADDRVSAPVRIAGSGSAPASGDGNGLRNMWTLWPFERIERRFLLEADQRGRLAFGPVRLAAADLFAGTAAEGELARPDALTIAPRSVPVRVDASRARWNAQPRPIEGYPEDPPISAVCGPTRPVIALVASIGERRPGRDRHAASGSRRRASGSCCSSSTSRPSPDERSAPASSRTWWSRCA